MKSTFKKLKYSFIDKGNDWKGPIEISHTSKKEMKGRVISAEEAKCNGLYIYKKGNDYIYIGQSKGNKSSILKRLYDHRREIWNRSNIKWHCFFSQGDNLGKLNVFWMRENNPLRRDALEAILTYVLKPRFCRCVNKCSKPKKKCRFK